MASSASGAATSSSGPVVCPFGFIGTRPKGARDFAWKYAFEGTKYNSVICMKCEKQIRGGISRLKYHLAGIEKGDTRVHDKTTKEIKREMIALLSAQEEKKLKREREKLATRASIYESQGILVTFDEEEALEGIVGSFRGPRICAWNTPTRARSSGSTSTSAGSSRPQNSSIDGYFVHRNTPGAQPSLEAIGWNPDVHEQHDIQCADFQFFNKLSFNVAASPYFLNFVTGCTVARKGYKPPTPVALSGR